MVGLEPAYYMEVGLLFRGGTGQGGAAWSNNKEK